MGRRIEEGYRGRFRALLTRQGLEPADRDVEALVQRARDRSRSQGVSLAEALLRVYRHTRESGEAPPATAATDARPRFLCDGSLGGLARWLRAAGYEARAGLGSPAAELIEEARAEGRLLLTSDSRFMRRSIVRKRSLAALWVSSSVGRLDQLDSVLGDLGLPVLPPRCMACGGELRPVKKAEVYHRIPPRTARWKDEYFVCCVCDRLFWQGTHWERIRTRLARVDSPPST